MKLNNPFEIDFPKTMEELAALDATREVPLLKALCNRRRIPVPGDHPTPAEILPIIEKRLAAHRSTPTVELGGGDTEWREINNDLQHFIRQLEILIDSQHTTIPTLDAAGGTPTESSPGQPAVHSETAGGTEAVQKTQTSSATTPCAPSESDAETDIASSEIPSRKTLIDQVEQLLAAEYQKPKKRKQKETTRRKTSAPSHSSHPSHESRHSSPPANPSHPNSSIPPNPSNSSIPPNPSNSSAPSVLCDLSAQPDSPKSSNSSSPNSDTSPASPPPNIIELSPGDLEIFADLHNASPLDALPHERQQKLYQLLATYPYRAVLRVISLPAPHGWGLQTSVASLERFRKRHEKRQTRQQLYETAQLAHELLVNKDATDADLLAASTRLANIRLLQTANDPNAKVRDLKDLFQIQIRLKNLDLTQQRLALQKQKQNENPNRGSRGDEALTSAERSAPQNAHETTDARPETSVVGPVAPRGPRADDTLPNNQPATSAPPASSDNPNRGSRGDKALTSSTPLAPQNMRDDTTEVGPAVPSGPQAHEALPIDSAEKIKHRPSLDFRPKPVQHIIPP